MQLRKAMESRRNVRRYSKKRPDWRKIIRAIDAARFSPSANDQFIMKFIMIDDESKIRELGEATQQPFVGTAPFVVVAVSDDSSFVRSYGDRGAKYSSQQSGAAIENFLLALTEEGLATSWVRYSHESQVKRILGISDDKVIDGIFPIGHETATKTPLPRLIALENILYFNKWGNKKMSPQTRVRVDSV